MTDGKRVGDLDPVGSLQDDDQLYIQRGTDDFRTPASLVPGYVLSSIGLSIASGKTFTVSNTLTLAGTDGSTLNVGGGGTLGSAAFTASSAYQAAGAAAGGDLAGNYPNPTIKASVALTTPDIGAATGTSLTASGVVKAGDGTSSAPGLSFVTGSTTGFYRNGSQTVAVGAGGGFDTPLAIQSGTDSAYLQFMTSAGNDNFVAFEFGTTLSFYVNNTLVLAASANTFGAHNVQIQTDQLYFINSSVFFNVADGVLQLWNWAGTSFGRLILGTNDATTNGVSLKMNAGTLAVRKGNDSADAPISASVGTFSGAINKVTITAPATGSTLTIADGKTFTASNTLTLAGTDGSTLNVGAGGTLGSAAFTASSAYQAAGAAAGGDLAGTYPNPTIKSSVSLTTPNINAATGTSLVLTQYTRRAAPRTVTTSTDTPSATDTWLIANRAGTVTFTLPGASTSTGRELFIKTVQAQLVNSNASNVVAIGGTSTTTAILAATAGKWCQLVSDGTNWITMAAN